MDTPTPETFAVTTDIIDSKMKVNECEAELFRVRLYQEMVTNGEIQFPLPYEFGMKSVVARIEEKTRQMLHVFNTEHDRIVQNQIQKVFVPAIATTDSGHCSICKKKGGLNAITSCGHLYHTKCLGIWITNELAEEKFARCHVCNKHLCTEDVKDLTAVLRVSKDLRTKDEGGGNLLSPRAERARRRSAAKLQTAVYKPSNQMKNVRDTSVPKTTTFTSTDEIRGSKLRVSALQLQLKSLGKVEEAWKEDPLLNCGSCHQGYSDMKVAMAELQKETAIKLRKAETLYDGIVENHVKNVFVPSITSKEADRCSVCMEGGKLDSVTSCRHVYHLRCLAVWVTEELLSKRPASCCLCRKRLGIKDVKDFTTLLHDLKARNGAAVGLLSALFPPEKSSKRSLTSKSRVRHCDVLTERPKNITGKRSRTTRN